MLSFSDIGSLLFVFGLSFFCFVRYWYLKNKMINLLKKQLPEICHEIIKSHQNIKKFINSDEDTGHNTIDVLRVRIREYRNISFVFLIGFGLFLFVMIWSAL
jgi:hypothetical protein